MRLQPSSHPSCRNDSDGQECIARDLRRVRLNLEGASAEGSEGVRIGFPGQLRSSFQTCQLLPRLGYRHLPWRSVSLAKLESGSILGPEYAQP